MSYQDTWKNVPTPAEIASGTATVPRVWSPDNLRQIVATHGAVGGGGTALGPNALTAAVHPNLTNSSSGALVTRYGGGTVASANSRVNIGTRTNDFGLPGRRYNSNPVAGSKCGLEGAMAGASPHAAYHETITTVAVVIGTSALARVILNQMKFGGVRGDLGGSLAGPHLSVELATGLDTAVLWVYDGLMGARVATPIPGALPTDTPLAVRLQRSLNDVRVTIWNLATGAVLAALDAPGAAAVVGAYSYATVEYMWTFMGITPNGATITPIDLYATSGFARTYPGWP